MNGMSRMLYGNTVLVYVRARYFRSHIRKALRCKAQCKLDSLGKNLANQTSAMQPGPSTPISQYGNIILPRHPSQPSKNIFSTIQPFFIIHHLLLSLFIIISS